MEDKNNIEIITKISEILLAPKEHKEYMEDLETINKFHDNDIKEIAMERLLETWIGNLKADIELLM